MSDFGSTSTKQNSKSPALYYESAALGALDKFAKIAQMGYLPYMGMDVAAIPQQTQDAMAQSNMWQQAFYDPTAAPMSMAEAQAGVAAQQPNTYIDPVTGISGTSSFPGYEAQLAALAAKYPGAAAYIKSMFMDPVTGTLSTFWDTKLVGNKALKKLKKKGGSLGVGSGTGTNTGTGMGPGAGTGGVMGRRRFPGRF